MTNDEWITPDEIFEPLDKIFGFVLDPCCNSSNHKTHYYITRQSNSLTYPWSTMNWVNPPYSRGNISKFMEKVFKECLKGNYSVCLVPASVSSGWFHNYAMKGRIYTRKGRISFIDPLTMCPVKGNRGDNLLIVFDKINHDQELFSIGWLRL